MIRRCLASKVWSRQGQTHLPAAWIAGQNSLSVHNEGGAAAVNNLFYAVAGATASGTPSAEVDVYDPTAVAFIYTKN